MSGERSHLLRTKKPQDTLSLDIDLSCDTKQDYPLKPTQSNINVSRDDRPRSDTLASVDGTASLFASDMHQSRDIQDLLVNLERATALVRRHLRQNENEGSQATRTRTKRPLIPTVITSYLLLITFIWQTLNIGFIEVIDRIKTDNSTRHDLDLASNVIMTVFQAAHLLLVFFISFKLAKQVIHGTASGSLLGQSYLSAVLLFAGLYTLLYRFTGSAFFYVTSESNERISPILLFLRMLYFSVSTATLCGTSEVEPREWYAGIIVSIQMLMSFVYFASILSTSMRSFAKGSKSGNGRFKSFTAKIRRCCFREES